MIDSNSLVISSCLRKFLAATFMSFFIFLASGCANLQAVHDFARISASTADYQQIVEDYATSPERQSRYQPERYPPYQDDDTGSLAEQKLKLEAAQRILVEYMAALAALAADDLPSIDTSVDDLVGSLEYARFIGEGDAAINKETGTAAAMIAKILTRAVHDHWRQAQTSQIVREANDSVQIVTMGLREIVLEDFSSSIDHEEEAVRKYFESVIAASTASGDTDAVPSLARIMWLEHSDHIETRRERLTAYADILEKIGQGHEDLKINVDSLENKALRERLRNYGKDLQSLYTAILTLRK